MHFKRVKVRANIHLNALERVPEGVQAVKISTDCLNPWRI
ncbi:hypothetical protein HHE02_09440 [Helicobacter heilmannii]|nr:hypothetical protein HHE02_09440 [Helicobacter heilmannii]CRF49608.1 hypothetical protein HHE03_12340 [Helicobacter heilmannii]